MMATLPRWWQMLFGVGDVRAEGAPDVRLTSEAERAARDQRDAEVRAIVETLDAELSALRTGKETES